MGAKNLNHEIVNRHFNDELEALKQPTFMYCKVTNSNIPVVIEILAISADRPERGALNSMLGHNGISSRRWRYSAYITPKVLKSCLHCMSERITALRSENYSEDYNNQNQCRHCSDWNFENPIMKADRPIDYPEEQHPESPPPPCGREVINIKKLYPIEITYDALISGVKFCFFNCYKETWTKHSSMVYLKSLGINERYANDNICDVAAMCRMHTNLDESSLFNHINFPVLWTSGLELRQCIDTPMHHIFQGIVKSIVDETTDWLTRKYKPKYKTFGDNVNNTLSQIHSVGVDWCRMEKLMRGRTYTTGGWQAEQYIAFARCMLVIYACIRDIVGDDELGIDEHEIMIQSLICFVSRLMHDNETDTSELMEYLKLFLSSCDMFEHVVFNMKDKDMKDKDPFWYKKGNFLSLLNLPSQIEYFGSLKNFWEGSRERSIQQIKPYLIKMRLTSSFYKKKLQRMYTTQTLQNICDDNDHEDSRQVPSYDRFLSFRVYSYNDVLESFVTDRHVISVIVLDLKNRKDEIFICQRSRKSNNIKLHHIAFDDKEGFNKCGLWYAPFQFEISSDAVEYTKNEIDTMVVDYALMLPCMSCHDFLSCCYAVISREWKTRTTASKLSLPMLSYDFVSSTIDRHAKKLRTF